MSDKEIIMKYKLYCKKEEEYKITYKPQKLEIGDKVEIMMPMLTESQFGIITNIRVLPSTNWNVDTQSWVTTIVPSISVTVDNVTTYAFKPNNLKKVD